MTNPDKTQVQDSAILFGEKLAGSETFRNLFREGMGLVEETAAYLDGEGRLESKLLSRVASLTYATESMRLTTRLMQLASWLLLQRAVNEGEMSLEQAVQEKAKVRIGGLTTNMAGPGWEELPQSLKDLVARSLRLQERIKHLDEMIYNPKPEAKAIDKNPVADAFSQLETAFAAQRR
jgi:regulator of CtrA degradation